LRLSNLDLNGAAASCGGTTRISSNSLIERKNQLSKLVQPSECNRLLFAQHIEEYGRHFFKEICSRELEGIVAKHKMSIYKPGANGWLKMKTPNYSQAEGRHELLTNRKTSK